MLHFQKVTWTVPKPLLIITCPPKENMIFFIALIENAYIVMPKQYFKNKTMTRYKLIFHSQVLNLPRPENVNVKPEANFFLKISTFYQISHSPFLHP